jgi:hypothetical protein
VVPGDDTYFVGTVGGGAWVHNVGIYATTVSKVNGRWPINGMYAGREFPLSSELAAKYPKGIRFTEDGYPDFSPYTLKTAKVDKFTTRSSDFTKADKQAGITEADREANGWTWHHHQDGKTLQLVPTDLHKFVKHTGGFAAR